MNRFTYFYEECKMCGQDFKPCKCRNCFPQVVCFKCQCDKCGKAVGRWNRDPIDKSILCELCTKEIYGFSSNRKFKSAEQQTIK